jgi:hypothetical protein
MRQGRRLNVLPFGAGSGGVSDELEGTQPGGMVIYIGYDHKFVGTGFRNERLDARANPAPEFYCTIPTNLWSIASPSLSRPRNQLRSRTCRPTTTPGDPLSPVPK